MNLGKILRRASLDKDFRRSLIFKISTVIPDFHSLARDWVSSNTGESKKTLQGELTEIGEYKILIIIDKSKYVSYLNGKKVSSNSNKAKVYQEARDRIIEMVEDKMKRDSGIKKPQPEVDLQTKIVNDYYKHLRNKNTIK